MPRPLTPCLDCHQLVRGGPRCEPCRRTKVRERSAERRSSSDRGYDSAWQRLRRTVIDAAPYCVRCGATEYLTADHIIPLSRGGTSDLANLQVLCRSHNAAKRDR